MFRYRMSKWEVVARMPKQWMVGNFRDWRIATTTKYLYARTPLGLFRATWDELKPK